MDRQADIRQAEVVAAELANRRAELCDLLDEHGAKLTQHQRGSDTAAVRRKRQQLNKIGAEISDIDRMLKRLSDRLLRD